MLRQATLGAVELAREHRISGWIADDWLPGPVRPTGLASIAKEVLPQPAQVGLLRFARLDAVDPLNELRIG